jgi:hypothetical protein
MVSRTVACWIGVGLLVGGCSALLDLNIDFAVTDQEQDGNTDGAPEEIDPCPHGSKRPPARPASTTDGPSIDGFVLSLKDAVFSNADAAINVDRVCTSQTGLWTCLPPPELARYLEGEAPIVPYDGPLGEENQFAREVFTLVSLVPTDTGTATNLEVAAQIHLGGGAGNPLVFIEGYNGRAYDPRVTVVISQAVFSIAGETGATMPPPVCIVEDPVLGAVPHVPHEEDEPVAGTCAGEEIPRLHVERESNEDGVATGITGYEPAWEEGRVWAWARHDSFHDRDRTRPTVIDDAAYVSDWTLVTRLPDNITLRFFGERGTLTARFTDAFAMLKLDEDLSGTGPGKVLVAGRWSVDALLEAAGALNICPGTLAYNVLRTQGEARTDVRSIRDQEGQDVACDAFSFGITMTAHRANFADITLAQPVPNLCAQ